MNANGFHHKQLGVIFTNLTVWGLRSPKITIQTFPDFIKNQFLLPYNFIKNRLSKQIPKPIISGFNGFVRPGEMCLVLGKPNSGCSTFLKMMANQTDGFMRVTGSIEYGGNDTHTMSKEYQGELVYNPEDDIHHPTLTVGQTLDFALSLKIPSKRLPNQTKKLFKEKTLDLLLRMLGISHTKDTLVGNAEIRGVSGGERKRVSIAEQLTTRACVLSWDNSTRGLDASSALEYAKSLRIMTNIFKTTMFVTLYQAGEALYDQFDKVCLINEGRQVYFGPASEARAYMINLGYKNLPRQTTADYLTGCTDPNARQFIDGLDPTGIPKTAEEMEQAYLKSQVYQQMQSEMKVYQVYLKYEQRGREEFVQAVKEDRHQGRFKRSRSYTVSFCAQVRALIMRDIQLKFQDRLGLIFSWAVTIFLALLIGVLFFDLPVTSAGVSTREGAIFCVLLFNVFTAFPEIFPQMSGRPILYRQTRGFGFYRSGALGIANTLADIPFSAPKMFIYCIIIYWMIGFVKQSGAFFTFYLICYTSSLALGSFFRLLGAISPNFDSAMRMASILITAMLVYSGYMIPEPSMKRWLVWLFYINPVNYTFEAFMINEFSRLNLTCDQDSIVPRGSNFPNSLGPNQVCTLLGALSGNPIIPGTDYLTTSYSYSSNDLWRNFGIELSFFFFFVICHFFVTEWISLGASMPEIHLFARENKERRELNERIQSRKDDLQINANSVEQNFGNLVQSQKPFTWEALTYDVKVSGGERRLLNEIDGYVKPGTLTALMGSSGAGKTTLLDVLASRKTTGIVNGNICVAGRAPGQDFQQGIGYCEQQDVHEWTSTVREAFRFSAYLRQSAQVSIEEKNEYVEEIIQLLEMGDIADAMIGFPGFGLGVEARKRVTIGVELAARPALLLFLDEPTSGLDGQSAYNIVRFLKKCAAAGQAILCTIHQPSALLFEHFDRLLLLKKGGHCVYFGEIGNDSSILRSYLERNGAKCPDEANPAEFMLEAIGAGTSVQMGGEKDWAERWLESEEHAENLREIERLKVDSLVQTTDGPVDQARIYAQPFWFQLKTVMTRTNLAYYRNPNYQFTRLYTHVSMGLLAGLSYLNLGNSIADLQQRVFSIFIAAILSTLVIAQVEPAFIMARVVHIREASSRTYSQEVFAISQFLAEMPYATICATVYFLLWYYPIGMNFLSNRAGYAFLMIWFLEVFAVSLGQAVAALSPSVYIASNFTPFIAATLSLFCGTVIRQQEMPKFLRSWAYELDPLTRVIGGLVVNELQGFPITCQPGEFSRAQPPNGQTCGDWFSSFINTNGGSLANPGSIMNCDYCQFAIGDEFFKPLNYAYKNRWRDLGIMAAHCIFNFVSTLLATKFLTMKYSHR
ncbi:hypothetical protein CROQUDRAFT_48718 [Cronartium quercuum f. sp. fusiforme G11]|uniref:ABC transporter domain-containing protein n=1 Tax=Cronartium quercuum f. sp. fusiforme G11 TaxID=708437 RepID=A0A9P6NGB6_9BASI|nr:hypothetical protein CROQUDRAFT_48718 [Cronartium quercuum f. sp. fusiforme G11]